MVMSVSHDIGREGFTERARQVVVLAQEEARALRHNYIGTEHILLGLLREEDGLAALVLTDLGLTVDRVRDQVVRIVRSGEEVTSGQIPFTPRAKRVLELALREALSLGHNYIGTEHLLLALVRENEGVAARILLDFDANPEKVHREVLRLLSGPSGLRWLRFSSDAAGARRTTNPLRPPLDWERAGLLWRPDRILRGSLRVAERLASVTLGELGLRVRVDRVRPQFPARPGVGQAVRPGAHRFNPQAREAMPPRPVPAANPGLDWHRATLLWRPEGLELRVPLRMSVAQMAAFAADEVWSSELLAGLRREMWTGWLALASPTLLDAVGDPQELRRLLDAAAQRAVDSDGGDSATAADFLNQLRADP
jgi:hypothetical protein